MKRKGARGVALPIKNDAAQRCHARGSTSLNNFGMTQAAHPRQGVPPSRETDIGPIPDVMLHDLRKYLWRMEHLPKYWGIGMAIVIGAAYVAGIVFFANAAPTARADRTSISIGAIALTVLAAMAYGPFLNRWFDSRFEVKWLREALYAQRLEDLAHYMAVCRMGGRNNIADAILRIWLQNGLEPGWSARRPDPRPQFR